MDMHAAKNKCYKVCQSISESSRFNLFIFIIIIANSVTMATYSYDQSESWKQKI